jgi:hypothetical protein
MLKIAAVLLTLPFYLKSSAAFAYSGSLLLSMILRAYVCSQKTGSSGPCSLMRFSCAWLMLIIFRIMGQLTLARFRGDTVFGLTARIIATFLGGVTGVVIWLVYFLLQNAAI